MSTNRREGNNRRQELIDATLNCIENEGLQGTTVRKVADYAGVTNGLIRFYFSGKDELMRAAYAALLDQIYSHARIAVDDDTVKPQVRLRNFISATLSYPIVAPRTVLLWANFLPVTYIDTEMSIIRNEAYVETTNILEPLIRDSFLDNGTALDDKKVKSYAIQVNAIIDGLWIEGSLAGNKFQGEELVNLGIEATAAILSLKI
ncbi:TetR/AcrR family transcriptional regulator [Marinomonas algicola]|jgi:TetR/AcrR family transcriptional regulator, transcriptional repressor of bet genes|uniref:TetR/AcrR family transcriptional regulator n=1 Tax=Marinomonas algicola TaxID=2773454 RepID=UPI00174D2666|nr:TetR family transcriptional regulator [Marinomonas algicola]